ncbi:serine/threonine kinase 16 [Aulographum hederae CBS 113979]|uniref:Serine/threonine kinase 16 n=1 Tax=Aulographum hederae CBS 113979 TaxID=1176131 RepID=A0A6G1GNJ9_9PEZI|nr:serine/threonine kinase 16 [Aulographum hederae CBS 113979]
MSNFETPTGDGSGIPGTVHLVDLEGTIAAKHAKGGKQDIVLVPAPSEDQDDPLNWTPRRKALSTLCMAVYTWMVGIASAAIYSILTPISEDTGLTLGDLNAGTGYMFLFFGWGCLVWQPLALQFGKRPVYLISILATMAIQIWAPWTTSNGQWIANKILQGFFGAPIESLCEISVTDIYFQHERGTYIALYALVLAGSNYFAPIISGFIADGMGWQWVLYWCAIFCGIGFVFLFFFMEETNYVRQTAPDLPPGLSTPNQNTPDQGEAESDVEKKLSTSPHVSSGTSGQAIPIALPQPRTYLTKLSLFQSSDLHKPISLPGMALRPLLYLYHFPIILYAGFSYGSNLVWFNVLNATASLILGTTYSFSASMVGLAYISPLIGTAVAAAYTGVVGDRFVLWLARRRAGWLESEYRLWLFAPSLLFVPGGLILWGVGAAYAIPWPGPVIAMAIIAFTNTLGVQLSVSYAIDSYRMLGGEAIVSVILVRNTMSFAVSYGITPWVDGMGLQNAFVTAGMVGLAQVLTVGAFLWWGKGLREKSRGRYGMFVEELRVSGLMH